MEPLFSTKAIPCRMPVAARGNAVMSPPRSRDVRVYAFSTRCPMPDIDPATATRSPEVGDTLRTYRADPRVGGAITFGLNCVIVQGAGATLRVGDAVAADWRFD